MCSAGVGAGATGDDGMHHGEALYRRISLDSSSCLMHAGCACGTAISSRFLSGSRLQPHQFAIVRNQAIPFCSKGRMGTPMAHLNTTSHQLHASSNDAPVKTRLRALTLSLVACNQSHMHGRQFGQH